MSYSSLPVYGRYYDANQAQQSANAAARHTPSNPYAPVTTFANDRQPQYSTSSYDLHGRNQSNYTQGTQPYMQQEQYDYRREPANYATQVASGNLNYNTSGATGRTSNLEGLNNLAYASGLDSQTSNRNPQPLPAQPNQQPSITRMQSPMQSVQQHQQSRYSSNPPSAYSRATTEPSVSPQVSVAQALAGAVSRKNQQTTANMQSQAPQRSASPYPAPQNHRGATSSQRQQTASSPNVSKQRAPNTRTSKAQRRQSSSTTVPSTSISNLVTNEPAPTTEPSAQDTMPTYIDPSQVFNPYHREHERRRKEAAEAEVKKQQEEARRKQEEAAKKAEEEAAAKAAAAAAEAAKVAKTQKARKRSRKKKTPEPQEQPANPQVSDSGSPAGEADMAAQMKLMMDKMREFRQQDPSMFQKLWDDMRKGGANVPTGSGPSGVPPTSPQIPQQAIAPVLPQAQARTPAPNTAAQSTPQPGLPGVAEPSGTPAPRKRERGPPRRPAGIDPSLPLNGFKVIVEDNDEDLPDLGRFPAERRIRATYLKHVGENPEKRAEKRPEKATRPPAPSGPLPTQPLPAKAAGGGIEWPKDKREALAKAAIEALKADKANESIEITAEDINAMLDQNPNYIDLCDMLEKEGLRFHRGQFARQLLTSVPDLSKVQKPDPPALVRPPLPPQHMQPPGTLQPQYPVPGPAQEQRPGAGPMGPAPAGFITPNDSRKGPPQMPTPGVGYGLLVPTPSMQASYQANYQANMQINMQEARRGLKRKSLPPVKPEPPPGSKEAMARKRNFSELVDLTQLSDNEDYVLSTEQPRPESPSPEPDLLSQFQMNGEPPQRGMPLQPPPRPGSYGSNYGLPQYAVLPPAPPPPQPQRKPKTILAKPVNKNEALAKEWYDPKTVARDIMIAAGRHPSERPLNAHMAGLLGTHIELDSDLTTFDWDAIDPGGPPAPKVDYVDIPAGPPRYRLGAKVHKRRERKAEDTQGDSRLPESAKRDPGDPPAPPAVATSTTPAPTTSPALFARLNVRKSQRKDDKDHTEARPSRLRESHNYTPDGSVTPSKRKASADPQDAPAAHATPGPASSAMDSDGTPSGAFYPSGKRRGRPPGSKNKTSGLNVKRSLVNPSPATPQIEIITDWPSPPPHLIYRCKWMRCKAELHNLETLRKHINKKHRPEKKDLAEARPFKCWWKHCPAKNSEGHYDPTFAIDNEENWMEHMNETHVHEVALKLGDGPNTSPLGKQESPPHKRRKVASSPEDDSEVIFIHSSPTPPGRPEARTRSYTDAQTLAAAKTRFLSDEKGRSITPVLTVEQNPELPSDAWIITSTALRKENERNTGGMDVANGVEVDANIQAQKAFLKTHRQQGERGAIGAKAAAEQTLKAMEKRKKDVGVGLDRGGCTLVNEARRATFVHAPGLRMEVDADY